MRFFETAGQLEQALRILAQENRAHLGMVSADLPLISNLDVWLNIALIPQYHENMKKEEAKALVYSLLSRMQLKWAAQERPPCLKGRERFIVMLLRATMVQEAVLVINQPFMIMPEQGEMSFLFDSLNEVKDLYRECHILDWSHMKQRYELAHET